MVPPSTMPETATKLRTLRSRVGSPTMIAITTAAPAPHDSTTAVSAPSAPRNRRDAVQVATENITATTAIEARGAAKTPRNAAATIASWTTARTEAMSTSRCRFSPAT